MKAICCIVAVAGLLISIPAMAQQVYTTGNGGGTTNIWSSAQGSSDSYGNANGFGTSSSGSMALGGGQGSLGTGFSVGGGMTATTSSYAGATRRATVTCRCRPPATPAAPYLALPAGTKLQQNGSAPDAHSPGPPSACGKCVPLIQICARRFARRLYQ